MRGTQARRFDTRKGTMYLTAIPTISKRGFIPFFVTARKRNEQALMQFIQEMWFSGISSRTIEWLTQCKGIEQFLVLHVSEMKKHLNQMVEQCRTCSLKEEYPRLCLALWYKKNREHGQKEDKAALVVQYLFLDGNVQVLDGKPIYNESAELYHILVQRLKEHKVRCLWLCSSSAQKGLQAANKNECNVSSCQQCNAHCTRTMLAHGGPRHKEHLAKELKYLWLQQNTRQARASVQRLIDTSGPWVPLTRACLEDLLQVYQFEQRDQQTSSVTNSVEQLNRKFNKRSHIGGIFPTRSSYIRFITTDVMEYEKEWQPNRADSSMQLLPWQKLKRKEVA